jgi:hypothetical protein
MWYVLRRCPASLTVGSLRDPQTNKQKNGIHQSRSSPCWRVVNSVINEIMSSFVKDSPNKIVIVLVSVSHPVLVSVSKGPRHTLWMISKIERRETGMDCGSSCTDYSKRPVMDDRDVYGRYGRYGSYVIFLYIHLVSSTMSFHWTNLTSVTVWGSHTLITPLTNPSWVLCLSPHRHPFWDNEYMRIVKRTLENNQWISPRDHVGLWNLVIMRMFCSRVVWSIVLKVQRMLYKYLQSPSCLPWPVYSVSSSQRKYGVFIR